MRYAIAMVLAMICGSCTPPQPPQPPPSVPPQPTTMAVRPAASRGPVILTIQQRHRIIVVRGGVDGPLYSIETRNGEVVVPDMTEGQLARHDPQLAAQIHSLQSSALDASGPAIQGVPLTPGDTIAPSTAADGQGAAQRMDSLLSAPK